MAWFNEDFSLDVGTLEEMERLAGDFADGVERDPMRYVMGTPPQVAVWSSPASRRLFRTGNQIGGKTTAGVIEAIWWATHSHPYRSTPSKPVQIWFICVSWTQSLAIQKKFWHWVPKDQLRNPDKWDDETGFGKNAPVCTFKDGSQVWFRTWNQNPRDQAGSTLHLVIGDEPPMRQRNYSELERRLTRTGGELLLLMTPVNARVDWIQELAESGALHDLHFRATPEMCQLADGTVLRTESGELMDAAWLANERRKVMKWEEPVVIDGEWEFREKGAIFEGWDPHRHVVRGLLDNPEVGPRGKDVRLCLGIDWGDESLRTAAVLVAVQAGDARRGKPVRVWVLAEYASEGPSTLEMDAAAILAMLASVGVSWSALASVHGDKRYTDARGRVTRKSNGQFESIVAHRLGLKSKRTVPRVKSAKRGVNRGAGALWSSVRWIHERMLTPGGLAIDKACAVVVGAIETWDGTGKHKAKDPIDAFRYSLVEYWSQARRLRGARGPIDKRNDSE